MPKGKSNTDFNDGPRVGTAKLLGTAERSSKSAGDSAQRNPRSARKQVFDREAVVHFAAHVSRKDDCLVQAKPLLELEPRWARILSADADTETIHRLRRHETTGRPFGSERFLKKLEQHVGRFLRPQKPGPKLSDVES